MKEKICKYLTYCYLVPLAFMVFFNIVNSFLRVSYFDLYSDMEAARYRWDNPLITIIGVALFLLVVFRLWKREQTGDFLKTMMIVWNFAIGLFFVLLFRCKATCDGGVIGDIVVDFMSGNFEAFSQGQYLYMYPFQIGFGMFLEGFFRIFGERNYLAFQIFTCGVVSLLLWRLYVITGLLFEDPRIQRIEALLSMGMFPMFLLTTFIYGDFWGFCLGIMAIEQVLQYDRTRQYGRLLGAGVLMGLGILMKTNINILLVAMLIFLLLKLIAEKQDKKSVLLTLASMVAIVCLSQAGVQAVNSYYANRAGLEELPAGIPKIAWVAMALQEGDEGAYACGWYNRYNWDVYAENGYDAEQTTKACIENLKGSFHRFAHEQRYTLNYFYKKYTSTWNSPSFQSLVNCEWGTRGQTSMSALSQFFIYGTGHDILFEVMNVYHFIIFLGTGLFFVGYRKNYSLGRAYLLLNIFGGFLFHMIWETQSRYILGYFVMLLPFAAAGICYLCCCMEKKMLEKNRKN